MLQSIDSASGQTRGIKSTGEAIHVRQESANSATFAQAITQTYNGTDATASDNVLLFTIANAEFYRRFTIAATAGSVDVEVSLDGANWSGPVPLRNTAGVALASDEVNVAAANTSVGILEGCFVGVRVRKKGVTNPTTAIAIAGG